ncbi:MAG: SDR family oxidoreductase [Planctomycetes bacterium]|nr:SDR family oxidoreductase [Planctomycetota bacterium]
MILVTGATGKVGGEVLKQLAAKGEQCRAMVRDLKKAAPLKGDNIELVQGDYDKMDSVEKALKGCEKLFLVSVARQTMGEPEFPVITAAKKAGIKHIVRVSALGAHVSADSHLLKWHGYNDTNLRKIGVPYTILKPHYFMQNFYMFVDGIKKQGAFYAPMKEGKIAAIDVRDIADCAVSTLLGKGHNGKAYDLTGGESLTMAQYAEKLSSACGKTIKYVDIPPAEAKKAMLGMGMPDFFADGLVALYTNWSTGGAEKVSDAVEKLTEHAPRSFDAFAKEFAGAVR